MKSFHISLNTAHHSDCKPSFIFTHFTRLPAPAPTLPPSHLHISIYEYELLSSLQVCFKNKSEQVWKKNHAVNLQTDLKEFISVSSERSHQCLKRPILMKRPSVSWLPWSRVPFRILRISVFSTEIRGTGSRSKTPLPGSPARYHRTESSNLLLQYNSMSIYEQTKQIWERITGQSWFHGIWARTIFAVSK